MGRLTERQLAMGAYAGEYPIKTVMEILSVTYPYHPMADVTEREPFKVLICCLLSIRSRDIVTMPVCVRLFMLADTPQGLLELPIEQIEALIEPVSFYRAKVDVLRRVCQELIERFDGQVPNTLEELESIKGVGRKTANLVLQLGFDKPAICVDMHVFRICNRLGYVRTKTPDATEVVLRQTLPPEYWNTINRLLVRHGQEVCTAVRPACDICPVRPYCAQVGVAPRKPPKGKRLSKAIHPVFQGRFTE